MVRTTTCRRCGRELKYRPLVWHGVETEMRPDMCDACYEAFQKERRRDALEEALRVGGVPESYWRFDRTIGNVDLLEWCLANVNKSMLLAGHTGMGKTRCLCRSAVEGLWRGSFQTVLFLPTFEWFRETMALMYSSSRDAEYKIVYAMRVDVLILDDLGNGKLTDRASEVLFSLVDRRMREGKRLWVTTNATGEQIEEAVGGNRGPALRRRIREYCAQYMEGK